jgi:hypothetical protein
LHSGKGGKICVVSIRTVSGSLATFLASPLTTVSVGSAAKGEDSTDEREHLEALKTSLLRLPKVHLYVLDAIVLHLKMLVPPFLCLERSPHRLH